MPVKTSQNSARSLIDALLASFCQHKASLHGRRIWLACSGGRDSLSLAAVCQQLYLEGELPFLPPLLHVNHGLQAASDTWADQVQAWADKHAMPCQVLTVRVDGSNEQAARQARYDAMMQVMNIGDVLMLGHHSDDQVETVLMRLFNGAGVNGLAGMRAWSDKVCQSETSKTIRLWRPWLQVSRAQITDFAQSIALDYIDDPTNAMAAGKMVDVGISTPPPNHQSFNDRAWLRSVIMPQIQARFPQASAAIARSSQLLCDASSIVAAQAQTDLTACLYQDINSSRHLQIVPKLADLQSILDIDLVLQLPAARQSALIHHWLSPESTDLPPPKRLVDDVLELCKRIDSDHQTCLHWQNSPSNSQHSFEIRRYQQRLFRLRSDWAAWLETPPMPQWFLLDSIMPSCCALKPDNDSQQFRWQLQYLSELASLLLDKVDRGADDKLALQLEPLPRRLALTIEGRVGSKSGKKLLQALHQPAFMRASVILCSVVHDSATDEAADKTPLFILSVLGVTVLNSSSSALIQSWLTNHQPVMQLGHTTHKS